MKTNDKMADDVDLAELAAITKNFSGAELEGLVRAAQSCALNRLVKVRRKAGWAHRKDINKDMNRIS